MKLASLSKSPFPKKVWIRIKLFLFSLFDRLCCFMSVICTLILSDSFSRGCDVTTPQNVVDFINHHQNCLIVGCALCRWEHKMQMQQQHAQSWDRRLGSLHVRAWSWTLFSFNNDWLMVSYSFTGCPEVSVTTSMAYILVKSSLDFNS